MTKYAFLITNNQGQWMLTSRDGKVCVQDEPQLKWGDKQCPVVIVSEHVDSVPLVTEAPA